MAFDPGLMNGQVLDGSEIGRIFKCSVYGGMNRSLQTNTLVLVSNHVKSIYSDRWIDEIFHYTGMGQEGDQSIDRTQNKTLAESRANGVGVHLFEVYREQNYTYQGRVVLHSDPYIETQPDKNNRNRSVYVFPLKLISGTPALIAIAEFERLNAIRAKKVSRLSDEEVNKKASVAPKKPGKRNTNTTSFHRNEFVSENAKRRAKGICQLCNEPAPFNDSDGNPFLETHHIVWLAREGEDSIANTVALCPNCHRRMHKLDRDEDKKLLLQKNLNLK
jgi:5-methylcytosine-specific restriction protein A